MAKKVIAEIKLQIPAGQANPSPPVGPALGQRGVNIMEFCKAFNAQTQAQAGLIIPVIITVYADRRPPQAGGGNRERLWRAGEEEGRRGDPQAGRGDRAHQDAGPHGSVARAGDPDGRGHGAQPRPRSRLRNEMAKHSKRYRKSAATIDRAKRYPLDEAIRVVVAEEGKAKFDETVELAVKLGVDPRQADQNVRGTVVLPHGTGKSVRVLVFAKGDKAKEAQEAG